MKKKIYNQPRVEMMQLMPSTVVLAGSGPSGIGNGGNSSSATPGTIYDGE